MLKYDTKMSSLKPKKEKCETIVTNGNKNMSGVFLLFLFLL